MRILYAIQGTGNGHLSRARDIVPALQKKGEVDILVSGIQSDVALDFPIKYQIPGLSFIFGKKGGINLAKTFAKANFAKLFRDIRKLDVHAYDLIINDFEPVSAWACRLKGKKCFGLSHQSAVIDENAPKPNFTDWLGEMVLKYYAPTHFHYGFHFQRYSNRTFTPVIRQEVRDLPSATQNHYTVYLPAYSDKKIISILSRTEEKWEVFSKHADKAYQCKNIHIRPISNTDFLLSMARCKGILMGAGFEGPAEALYLNKKLMVIPMKGQYEQHCNAAALKTMGVPVIKSLRKKHLHKVNHWLESDHTIAVNFPNQTDLIIERLIEVAENYKAIGEPALSLA